MRHHQSRKTKICGSFLVIASARSELLRAVSEVFEVRQSDLPCVGSIAAYLKARVPEPPDNLIVDIDPLDGEVTHGLGLLRADPKLRVGTKVIGVPRFSPGDFANYIGRAGCDAVLSRQQLMRSISDKNCSFFRLDPKSFEVKSQTLAFEIQN